MEKSVVIIQELISIFESIFTSVSKVSLSGFDTVTLASSARTWNAVISPLTTCQTKRWNFSVLPLFDYFHITGWWRCFWLGYLSLITIYDFMYICTKSQLKALSYSTYVIYSNIKKIYKNKKLISEWEVDKFQFLKKKKKRKIFGDPFFDIDINNRSVSSPVSPHSNVILINCLKKGIYWGKLMSYERS